jgi:hypothetical protein
MTESLKIRDTVEYKGHSYCFEATVDITEEQLGKITKTFLSETKLYEVRKISYTNSAIELDSQVGVEWNGAIVPLGTVEKIDGDFVKVHIFGYMITTWLRKSDLVQLRGDEELVSFLVIGDIISEMGVDLGE